MTKVNSYLFPYPILIVDLILQTTDADQDNKKSDLNIFADFDFDQLRANHLECDLIPLGVTGVEDLLQEGVKKCITDFKASNIKVWMLTGDKGLTAKMIGIQCGLVSGDQKS